MKLLSERTNLTEEDRRKYDINESDKIISIQWAKDDEQVIKLVNDKCSLPKNVDYRQTIAEEDDSTSHTPLDPAVLIRPRLSTLFSLV